MVLNKGDEMKCPHCDAGFDLENLVEDFCIPGAIGDMSLEKHQCDECDAFFTVSCLGAGEYEVLAI